MSLVEAPYGVWLGLKALPEAGADLRALAHAWRRLGFDDSDIDARTGAGRGSDRLVDALVAQGGPETVKARLDQHPAAGADHVCVQPLPLVAGRELDDLRALAAVLF